MKLEQLIISHQSYGVHAGKYTGTASFKGQYGGVDIVLSPEVSVEVLKLCADALISNARDVANNLTAQIIERSGVAAIEDKSAS